MTVEPTTAGPRSRSLLWQILGAVVGTALLAVVVYFFYNELSGNWQEFLEYRWEVSYGPFVVSVALLVVAFVMTPLAWVSILRLQGEHLGRLQAFLIFYLANLGKYIPGKLWGYGGQIYLTRRQGITVQHTVVSTVVLLVLDYFAGLAFASLTLLFWPKVPAAAAMGGAVLVVIIVALISWSERALDLFKRALARMKVTAFSEVPAGKALFHIWLFLLVKWLIIGLAFVIGIRALLVIDITESVAYCGAFTWAHLLSMIVFVTPAGLGIREGLNVYFLGIVSSPPLPLTVAIGISVATRLWMTLTELVCVLPAVGVRRILK